MRPAGLQPAHSQPNGPAPAGDSLLQPAWPAPPGVRAVFSTRVGGASVAPFDSFNLGDHVRDDPTAVSANRQRLQRWLGARPVFLRQVHGCQALELEPGTPDGAQSDACLSTRPGLACTIMVADCLPVLLAHRSAPVVAAAHAGWRGLAGVAPGALPTQLVPAPRPAVVAGPGVLEATFEAFACAVLRARKGTERAVPGAVRGTAAASAARASATTAGFQAGMRCSPQQRAAVAADTLVWLGPCIGPQAFQVGEEVRAAFLAHDARASACFSPLPGEDRFMADLAALARQRLQAMGIGADQLYGNDSGPGWCTFSEPSRFFSHRRDAARLGSTGRMAACIWLD